MKLGFDLVCSEPGSQRSLSTIEGNLKTQDELISGSGRSQRTNSSLREVLEQKTGWHPKTIPNLIDSPYRTRTPPKPQEDGLGDPSCGVSTQILSFA